MDHAVYRRILSGGIIAICRRIALDDLLPLASSLYEGGIRQLEVTFDQSDPDHIRHTCGAITQLCSALPEMDIGAGTVLTVREAEAAKAAGGRFIVSPSTDPAVIARTKELGMVSIPGAMTPSEIVTAHQSGADIVKVFPVGRLGPGYIKDIATPLSHIRLLATAGITVDNFAQFLQAGCCGAGISSPLCRKDLMEEKNWKALTAIAAEFVAIHRQFSSVDPL